MKTIFAILFLLLGVPTIVLGNNDDDSGIVICGKKKDVICRLDTTICCQGLNSAKCTAPDGCRGIFNAPVYCDGPEDCRGENKICCAKFSMGGGSGTRCEDTCAGTKDEAILCHSDNDCNLPTRCMTCQPPGGPAVNMCVEACPY
ncbi:MAG: hypothetical protein HQK54_06060 [Oligoflexales bacterium]|nr:hypothetical protein [Oligoflexales bacterium]